MSAPEIARGEAAISLAEARDWLRLTPSEADANIAGLIRAATNLCEAFTGQMLVVREVAEERAAAAGWMALRRQPVVGIDAVLRLHAGGEPVLVPGDGWAAEIDASGAAAVRLSSVATGERVQVRYRAGIAGNASGVPEALRQGLLRLVQHWHFGGQADDHVPAIITALWTPWRRVTLGARP